MSNLNDHVVHQCFISVLLDHERLVTVLVSDEHSPLVHLVKRVQEYSHSNLFLMMQFFLEMSEKHVVFPSEWNGFKVTCYQYRVKVDFADRNLQILLRQIHQTMH